ncbi:MAG: 50S ribosomal protein L11 methyltransferase [Candidatus Polarisedimenticolaceae bacterium]|nr:50S ribosomal protein L11 methyltransferase [Candidatus Polarisedimenticolaceae bacterium]
MPWLQFKLTTSQEQSPLIELLFENMGALAITLGDAGDQPILEPGPNEQPLWNQITITALFDGESDADQLRSTINQSLNRDISSQLKQQWLDDQTWERVWLEHFHPMQFGSRLWVCPDGQRPDTENAVVLELDPGLAFGTGTHPTTALCLRWLDGHEISGKTVIDYGCGSGILAIAALLLGAKSVLAIDHDPQALLATADNAKKNGVTDRLTITLPDEAPSRSADIILANILAGPLVELAPKLANMVNPGGEIILSGILQEQAEMVRNAYLPHFNNVAKQTQEDWVLLHGRPS